MNDDYTDIIHLPHHVSTRHPQMPMITRAAQFAPFSALTGLDDALDETAQQLIEDKLLMDEYEKIIHSQ
ncbi:MAG: hypothetical protein J6T96_04975 [Bacteroidales bacterium]|nr:hypothetical protein [Bacteroidales bacterium]MBO7461928.1 hypothetical protein [Bacteroidales bacterium]MBO7565864.1 hypothetical protein [Bacteroidales bacterium]